MSKKTILNADYFLSKYDGNLSALARLLTNGELDAVLKQPGKHVVDPVVRGTKKAFRVHKHFDFNGKWYSDSPVTNHGVFNLVMYVTRLSFKEVMEIAKSTETNATTSTRTNKAALEKQRLENERKLAEQQQIEWEQAYRGIKRVLGNSLPIDSLRAHPIFAYLGGTRKIPLKLEDMPKELGFHPNLKSWNEDLKPEGVFPCLLAKVTDSNNKLVTLHRTYLTEKGEKAPVESPKKLMSVCRSSQGASIKLYDVSEEGVLAVSEGIETALAVRVSLGLPVWSTVNATMMANLIVPDSVRTLLIYADKDKSEAGQLAAEMLRNRFLEQYPDRICLIFYPEMDIPDGDKGVDWHDEMTKGNAVAFSRTLIALNEEIEKRAAAYLNRRKANVGENNQRRSA